MKEYRVALSRAYIVTIQARSEEQALRFSEFYVGDSVDASTLRDRMKNRFRINDIEMVINDAIDIEEVTAEEIN